MSSLSLFVAHSFLKSGSNDAWYNLKSVAAFSLFLYLFLIKMYNEKTFSTSSVLVNGNRNSSVFLISIQKLISSFLISLSSSSQFLGSSRVIKSVSKYTLHILYNPPTDRFHYNVIVVVIVYGKNCVKTILSTTTCWLLYVLILCVFLLSRYHMSTIIDKFFVYPLILSLGLCVLRIGNYWS